MLQKCYEYENTVSEKLQSSLSSFCVLPVDILKLMEKYLMNRFFEEKILPHYDSVYYYVLKTLKNREAAEDVVQSAIEKAWKNLRKLKDPDRAKQWFFAIARNELYSALRRYGTLKEYEFTEERMTDCGNAPGGDVLKLMMKKQEERNIMEAVKRIPEKYRVLIELRYYWDYSLKEISKITGIRYSSVRVYIRRALKELLKSYEALERERGDR